MRRLVISALAALAVAACASAPTRYQPAAGPDAIGYSEYRIEPGRYRIMFRGGSGASAAQVMDYALIRASDLALAEGYDWFRVSDRVTTIAGNGYGYGGPHVSVGVGGVDYGRSSSVGVGIGTGFSLGGGGNGAPIASIEIFMGRGPRPPGLDAYDARAVRNTLGAPA